MPKYHLTAKGEPAPCSAQLRPCPRGGEEAHYPTPEAAQQAFEASMGSGVASSVSKKPYPVAGDTVRIAYGASAAEASLGKYEGLTGKVTDFNGSTYEVELPDGKKIALNHQYVGSVEDAASSKVGSSSPVAEPRPSYPVAGDAVTLNANAATWDAKLARWAGKEAVVKSFNGSSYEIEFSGGGTVTVPWNLVKDSRA